MSQIANLEYPGVGTIGSNPITYGVVHNKYVVHSGKKPQMCVRRELNLPM